MDAADRPTLRTAANSLSGRNRLIFLLHYAERLSIDEIGAVLDLEPERVALGLAEIRFMLGQALRAHRQTHQP